MIAKLYILYRYIVGREAMSKNAEWAVEMWAKLILNSDLSI